MLLILDGFGVRDDNSNNAVALAKKPNISFYQKNYLYTKLNASESFVGLPKGMFGNSEVGHLNIGAGRVVAQVINTIDTDIESGNFYKKTEFVDALNNISGNSCHIMGLLSDGAVHAMNTHYYAFIELASQHDKIEQVWLHVFLDGRDTPPNTGSRYVQELLNFINNLPEKQRNKVKIATVSGRYYAMDRDKRFERTEDAYNAIVTVHCKASEDQKLSELNLDIMGYIEHCYQQQIFDEFIPPYVCAKAYTGVHAGDVMFFANYRADRAIQLIQALSLKEFTQFERHYVPVVLVTMTQYEPNLLVVVAYKKQQIVNTLGEVVAKNGGSQLRVAETEKYPHVTYFFSGGLDELYPGEDRLFVQSPKEVASYDQKPEMSLPEVTDKMITAIKEKSYNLVVANFANGDMVGHTGILPAAIKAVEALDHYVGKVVEAALALDYGIIITADHGNCEQMYDEVHHLPHTQHTTNLVPFIYISKEVDNAHLLCDPAQDSCGSLRDIAPTILYLLGLAIPEEMTGRSLVGCKE